MLLDEFTEREHEILQLMLEGMNNREIAEHLTVSVETVRWYCKQIYSKLDAHSRAEAIITAQELGFGEEGTSPITVQHNLPTTLTPFIGRQHEINDLQGLLNNSDTRLITILGAGGMGKTRLALALAQSLISRFFSDGIYFIPLQALSSSEHLVSTIGHYSNYQFQLDGRSPKQQILDYLQEKQLLLLMDNFEHLLDGASVLSEILQAAPQVKILATSRERLNIYGETIFAISGLEHSAESNDAQELFQQSARHLLPDWQASETDLASIQQICQQVEGMPLGIELAAAWIDILSPQEIAEEISASMDILQSSLQDIPERHRSMRAMLETTWQRLDENLQAVFIKLSVFRGGFTREAAQAVADMSLQNLQALIDKALIRREENRRFSIHELLRQFAEQKLAEQQLADETWAAHLSFFADFVRERELDIKGRRQIEGLKDFDADFENVRAAWQFAVAHHNYDTLNTMLEGIKLFCEMRNRYQERLEFFVETRKHLFDESETELHPLFYRMMVRHAGFMGHQGDFREAFTRCLDFARHSEDEAEIAYCLYALADAHASLRDPDGIPLYEKSLQLYQELDDKFYITQVLNRLGAIYVFSGQLDTAHEYGKQSLEYGRQCADLIDTGWALHTVATVYMLYGNVRNGAIYFEEARQIWLKVGHQEGLATALFNLAIDFVRQSKLEIAHDYAAESLRIARNINNKMRVACVLCVYSQLASWQGDYESALELAQRANPDLDRMPPIKGSNMIAMLMAAIGLQNYELACTYLKDIVLYAERSNPQWLPIAIAMATLIFAAQARYDYASELLGLTSLHNQTDNSFATWPPLVQLPEKLKAALGEEAYNKAYERGKTLNLDKVIQDILTDFGNE